MRVLLKASEASAMAILKYSSFEVNEELRINTMLEAVSQMALLGPSKGLRACCSKAMFFFFYLADIV